MQAFLNMLESDHTGYQVKTIEVGVTVVNHDLVPRNNQHWRTGMRRFQGESDCSARIATLFKRLIH